MKLHHNPEPPPVAAVRAETLGDQTPEGGMSFIIPSTSDQHIIFWMWSRSAARSFDHSLFSELQRRLCCEGSSRATPQTALEVLHLCSAVYVCQKICGNKKKQRRLRIFF